jgi:hypothetical protein
LSNIRSLLFALSLSLTGRRLSFSLGLRGGMFVFVRTRYVRRLAAGIIVCVYIELFSYLCISSVGPARSLIIHCAKRPLWRVDTLSHFALIYVYIARGVIIIIKCASLSPPTHLSIHYMRRPCALNSRSIALEPADDEMI